MSKDSPDLPSFAIIADDHPDREKLLRHEILAWLAPQEYAWADGRRGFVEVLDWTAKWLDKGELPETEATKKKRGSLHLVEAPPTKP